MLLRESIAVCSEIRIKKHTCILHPERRILNVKPGGTYSNYHALKQSTQPAALLFCPWRHLKGEKKSFNPLLGKAQIASRNSFENL